MTDTRKVMQQALEAIQDLQGYRPDIDSAIEALREALAQQGEQQPYLHVYEYDSVQFGVHREFYPREWNGMKPTRTVPLYIRAAQGCDYCNHPLFAGLKCKNCGREFGGIEP